MYREIKLAAYRSAQDYSITYLTEIQDFSDTVIPKYGNQLSEEFIDLLKEQAYKMCQSYDLTYVYMYVPDVDANAIDYLMIISDDEHKSLERMQRAYVDKHQDYVMPEHELGLWNGETDFIYSIVTNTYGQQFEGETVFHDPSGNRALLGIGFPFSVLTATVKQRFQYLMILSILFLILIIFSIQLIIHYQVSKPAKALTSALRNYIQEGKKETVFLDVKGEDEFAVLSDAYNHMIREIDDYVENIAIFVQNEERIRNEMQFAGSIQMGFLPGQSFRTDEYEVHAKMVPAKNVGGDLYDYQQLDEDRTLFVIADVSGKGITASLFMAMTLTLIRQLARLQKSTSEILSNTNETLAKNNPQMMFVTAFIAIYDKKAKTLTYTNAGHNLPYILRDKPFALTGAKKLPLGVMEGLTYPEKTIPLESNDILFLYTDGVNEAANDKEAFYGTPALEERLSTFDKNASTNCVDWVYDSVTAFAGTAEQSDDITILTVQFT